MIKGTGKFGERASSLKTPGPSISFLSSPLSSPAIDIEATHKRLLLSLVLNDNLGFSSIRNDLERPVLHVGLNFSVGELASDQTFRVEDLKAKQMVVSKALGRERKGSY